MMKKLRAIIVVLATILLASSLRLPVPVSAAETCECPIVASQEPRIRSSYNAHVEGQVLAGISEGVSRQGEDDTQVHDLFGPFYLDVDVLNTTPLYVSVWVNDSKAGGGAGYPYIQVHAHVGDYILQSPASPILAVALGFPILNASVWCHQFSAGPRCVVAGTYLAGGTTPSGFVAVLSLDDDAWTIEDLELEQIVGSSNHTYMVDMRTENVNATTTEQEIVICGWYTNTTGGIFSGGCALWVYRCDGSTITLESLAAWDDTAGGIRCNALDVADLKQDGYVDVVVVGWLREIGSGSGARNYAFDGETFPWIGAPDDSEGFAVTEDGSMMNDVVICDYDGDGLNESVSVGQYWTGGTFYAFYVVEEWTSDFAATLGTYFPKTGYASMRLYEVDAVNASDHEGGLDLIIVGNGRIQTDHYIYVETINASTTITNTLQFAAARDDLRAWIEIRIEDDDSYALAWSWEESAAFSWNFTMINGDLEDYWVGEGHYHPPGSSPPSPPPGRYPDHIGAQEAEPEWRPNWVQATGWYAWILGAAGLAAGASWFSIFHTKGLYFFRGKRWRDVKGLLALAIVFTALDALVVFTLLAFPAALDPVVVWLNGLVPGEWLW